MKFMQRIKKYETSHMRQDEILTKDWFIFRWEIFLIVVLGMIAALLNQIPNWVVQKDALGNVDPIFGYPLRDNIIYSSVSIFVTIGIAIFIGVFSEIGKFAGKYGSALFILVPSFVWLLSDRSDNHIEHVLDTAKLLGTIIFWSMVTFASVFVVSTVLKQIFVSNALADKTKLKIEFVYNFLNRFLIVQINVLIVLMLGYGLINYGIFSLHLADNVSSVAVKEGPYNLHSENFTIFIAVIAVVFALIMVITGLAKTSVSTAEANMDKVREDALATREINAKAQQRLEELKKDRRIKEEGGR